VALRSIVRLALVATAAVPVLAAAADDRGAGKGPKPDKRDGIVIGHRGASGDRPEHTLAAYRLAIKQCADYIEPDLVSTRDHVLVARHENDIAGTTDVADHPEFADRRTTKVIDGISITGWFTEDFTLAELKMLRAKERIADVRPGNAEYDGRFEVPTLREVLKLARRSRTCDGRPVGVYPETKHPSYFDSIGLSLEEPLVRRLHARGYRGKRAAAFIQSFEVASLQQLREMTRVPLVQLVNCGGQPWDFTVADDPRTYADLVTPAGLDFVRTYASGIAACKDVVVPRDGAGNLTTPTPVVADAHARRLVVHAWTFRAENQFLPTDLRSSADPNAPGDLTGEIDVFLDAGIDGFFTDNPKIARGRGGRARAGG
jgi:glycerophosphoryl diester phosphodiesterase